MIFVFKIFDKTYLQTKNYFLFTVDNDVAIKVENKATYSGIIKELTDNHLILGVNGADVYIDNYSEIIDIKPNGEYSFRALGDMLFYNTSDGIKTIYRDINSRVESVIKSIPETMQSELEMRIAENMTKSYFIEDCDLIDGREFLDDVLNDCLTDCDGYINNVFVDGYKSNLGLIAKNLKSGKFLVDSVMWSRICDKHTVYVDWVGK